MKAKKKSKPIVASDLPKKKANKIYFTTDTEAAIIEYNNTDPNDIDARENIFRTKILYPLNKLIENIINRFKFSYVDESIEDIQVEVMSFLVENLWRYKQGKGKAFAYFSIITKNYLILRNNIAYKEYKFSTHLNDTMPDSSILVEDALLLEAPDPLIHEDEKEFSKLLVQYWDNNTEIIFKKRRDQKIAYAIVELFRRPERIESFSKKNLYILIREMTDCKTGHITKVMNKMGQYVKIHKKEFYKDGVIDKHD